MYRDNFFETRCVVPSLEAWKFVTLDKVETQSGKPQRVSTCMKTLPFHPTYQSLVCNRCFKSGALRGEDGLQFIALMMRCLHGVEGAFFCLMLPARSEVCRFVAPWATYIAGWRQNHKGRILFTHVQDGCQSGSTVDVVITGDKIITMISKLTGLGRREAANPSLLKHLQYKVHIHACARPEDDRAVKYATVDEFLGSNPMREVICTFTPASLDETERMSIQLI